MADDWVHRVWNARCMGRFQAFGVVLAFITPDVSTCTAVK